MSTTVLAVAAGTWGVAMAVAPVLQIRRILAQGSSRDVSLGYLIVLLVGFVLWFAYGTALENYALIVPNAIAFCVVGTTIAVALHYRRAA